MLTVSVLVLLLVALAAAATLWGADSRDGRDWKPLDEVYRGGRSRPSAWGPVRGFCAEQVELHERLALVQRPWEEHFLHWVGEGADRRLHGSVPPPAGRRRRSTTRAGWCPGQRAQHRPVG